jgi:L-fucose mutarotase
MRAATPRWAWTPGHDVLKGIDPRATPDLLRDLAAMGHYESLLVADGNFPVGRLGGRVHYLPLPTADVLDIVLSLVPVETAAPDAVVIRSDTPTSPLDAVQERSLARFQAVEPAFAGFTQPTLPEFLDAAVAASVAIVTADAFPSCYVIRRGVISV